MVSFGQRLKMLRKEAELSQSEFAEVIGVSVQSVSKWECDTYMPDVSLILPISKILGVTADCLLGAGENEKEDRLLLNEELKRIDEAYPYRSYKRDLLKYKATKEFLRRYPLNYDVKYSCAEYLKWHLYDSTWPNAYSIPREDFDALYAEGVKMVRSIIEHDKDPSRQIKARESLIVYYSMKEKWDEAEAVALELPDICELRNNVLARIAGEKRDLPKALELRRIRCANLANYFLSSMSLVGRRTSIFGNVRKAEAIEAWNDMKKVAAVCIDVFSKYSPEEYRSKAGYYIEAVTMISNECLAIDDLETALSSMEDATDTAIEVYGNIKRMNNDPKFLASLKEEYRKIPEMCRDKIYANDDNPLSKHERTKSCIERLEKL